MAKLVAILGLTALAHADEVRFDFGSVQLTAPKPWNSVLRWRHPGPLITDALDTSRRRTTVCLQLLDPWAGVRTGGSSGRRYPAAATADSFYLKRGVDERARLRLDGLVPGASYRIARLGSTRATVERRADAEGKIEIGIGIAAGESTAHLAALVVSGRFPGAKQRRPAPGPRRVSAWAWVIADAASGEVLWERNADVPLPPGSTSKIMTGYLVLRREQRKPGFLQQQVTISRTADSIGGTSAWIRRGWRASVDDLMYGMLLPSGNDAAAALGEHCFGSIEDCTRAMNRAARRLKLAHSHFVHPHGLDAVGQYQSARDLLRITREFLALGGGRYVSAKRHRVQVRDGKGRPRTIAYLNSNKLLGEPGYDGVKTGWTPSGMGCLVVRTRRGDRTLLVVLMRSAGAASRFSDARKLCEWAWRNL